MRQRCSIAFSNERDDFSAALSLLRMLERSDAMASEENSGQTSLGNQPGAISELLHTWRYFFLFLGLVALVAAFYAEEDWRGHRAWAKYKRELEAQGVRFDLSAHVPPSVPPEENFAVAIEQAIGMSPRYDAVSGKLRPQTRKEPYSNSWVTARMDLRAWQAAFLTLTNNNAPQSDTPTNPPPGRAQAAADVLAALSDCEAAIAELREASQRPFSRFRIVYGQDDPASILLPHLGQAKWISQVVQLRSTAELALHRTDEAFRDVMLLFSLADASRDEPLLISQLVRLSIMSIVLRPLCEGMDQWSELQLSALQQRLVPLDLCKQIRRALEAESILLGNREIDYLRGSPGKLKDLQTSFGTDAGISPLLAVAPGGWFDFEQVNYTRLFREELLPTIDVRNRQIAPSASRRLEQRFAALKGSPFAMMLRHDTFAALLLPHVTSVAQKTSFFQTGVDAATVACALQRYRLEHGRFPDTLDPLVPQFMTALPHDVINGQPLHYRRTAGDQFVLYSVGWNETDDGGTVGVSKTGDTIDQQAGDWVWASSAPTTD
jgi:hypothetical protein